MADVTRRKVLIRAAKAINVELFPVPLFGKAHGKTTESSSGSRDGWQPLPTALACWTAWGKTQLEYQEACMTADICNGYLPRS